MFDDSCFTNEVTDFRNLRTGHKRLRVVVVDENRKILFIARVLHNRPCTSGRVAFDNGKGFDLKSRTVNGQKVSLFLHTEELDRRWQWQRLIDRIHLWLECARPEDVVVFGGLVIEESGRVMFFNHPSCHVAARQEIMRSIMELGFVQLQRLVGMLCLDAEEVAA